MSDFVSEKLANAELGCPLETVEIAAGVGHQPPDSRRKARGDYV